MKDYIKKQHTGNELGWGEPVTEHGVHRIPEAQADELNSQFRNTGTRYEEVEAKDAKPDKKKK